MKASPGHGHSHAWLVGVVGLAVGITLMVVFPKLDAVAGAMVLVALFVFCFLLTGKAGWRKLVDEVGFTRRDEGTFNGMWFTILERPT